MLYEASTLYIWIEMKLKIDQQQSQAHKGFEERKVFKRLPNGVLLKCAFFM